MSSCANVALLTLKERRDGQLFDISLSDWNNLELKIHLEKVIPWSSSLTIPGNLISDIIQKELSSCKLCKILCILSFESLYLATKASVRSANVTMPNKIKSSTILRFLKRIGYHLFVSVHAVILFVIFPILLLILFLPMWITRQSVKLLAKVIRPDLCEMATCATSVCANVNGTEDNPRMVSLVELLFKDKLDHEQIAMEFNSRAVEKVNKAGKLQYPTLQQHLTSFFGFWFWKTDNTFHLKNHIVCSTMDKDFVTLEDLRRFEEQLLSKPFEKNRSPWELHVILSPDSSRFCSDFLPEITTTIIFRCSHILGDGYSVKKLLQAVGTVKISPKLKTNYPSTTLIQQFFFPFKFYYTMAEVQVFALMNFPFKINDAKKSKVDTLQTSDVIPIDVIRYIKNRYGVSFSSVVISIATGALRKLALKHGIQLTETVPCAIPLPKPGHPDTLANHFTMAILSLPIGTADPGHRLKICHKELKSLKSSPYPTSAACFMAIFGSFFHKVGEIIGINTFSAVNMSYLPSGLDNISFLGVDVWGQTFCMSVQKGSIGAVITISSYKDRIQMHATIDSNVLPRDVMMEFKNIVNEEVAALTAINCCDV